MGMRMDRVVVDMLQPLGLFPRHPGKEHHEGTKDKKKNNDLKKYELNRMVTDCQSKQDPISPKIESNPIYPSPPKHTPAFPEF
jgi:hypothetical protein